MQERERFLSACLHLALERGYGAVTLAAVIERAGLDRSAFDRHFADLEDCLLAVYREASDQMLRQLTEAVEAQPTWLDQMRALGVAMIDFLREDEPRARFIVVEVVSGGERIRLAREQDLQVICEMIDRGRLELEDPDSVGPDTAMAVAGAIFLQTYQGMLRGELANAYEQVPEMLYTLVLPYLGEQVALQELSRPAPNQGDTRSRPAESD